MKNQEYTTRVCEIRKQINTLASDMGATHSGFIGYLEKIINDAVNGDLTSVDMEANVEIPHGMKVPLLKTDCKYFKCVLPFY